MLNGIDISNWQNGINLNVVPADFVIMKATQGTWYVSEDCDRQYQQAKASGKLLGVYHYAEGSSPVAEAKYFLENVKNYIHEAILCLDWEGQDNPRFGNNDKAWVKEFCDYIAKETGVNPIVYTSASVLPKIEGIGNYGLWVAQYPNYDPTGYVDIPWNEGAYACTIRQYSSTGRLNGYSGNLDLNKFYGDREAWLKYANPSKQEAPKVKTIDELAYEVIGGVWGNGQQRIDALTNAGYDAGKVQTRVNEILDIKTIDDLAKEVIRGDWGNEPHRSQALKDAGYDAGAIQKRVNEMMG